MSPAALHHQSPINSSSDATPRFPFHHNPFPHFDADALNPSASTTVGSAPRVRSRPRLAKLRKQSASQHARSRTRTTDAGGDEGSFNPFRSDQVNGNNSGVYNSVGACDDGSSYCHHRLDKDVFVFSARKCDSDSARDLNSEQSSEKGTCKEESESRKSGGVEFVFSANRNDAESNSAPERREKGSESAARTVSGDERKMASNSKSEQGEFDGMRFVFSAGLNNSVSSSNLENGKSSVRVGNSGFDAGGEGEHENEFECDKRDCLGDSGNTSSFNVEKQESIGSIGNWNHGIGVFNTKTETNSNSKNYDKDADQCDHLSEDDKCKSRYASATGVSADYNDIPACILPDEMQKLNMNHSEDADIARDSVNSHVNGSAGFVFGGNDKGFGHCGVNSGTDADGLQSCTNATFEKISGKYVKSCGTNNVPNGTVCGCTGIPCSKPSTSQEGIKHFQCGKIPECSVSEDSRVKGATPSFAFMSANSNNPKNCFASIPEASKESFRDFKPPSWDPSCFKDNLFPKLNKKLESTQKGSGSKFMRRKLKPHSLNKKQTRLHMSKENSSLETPDSSGDHSPMDFSPYQETAADDRNVEASEELNDLRTKVSADLKDVNTTDQRSGDPDNDNSHNGTVWPNMKMEQGQFGSSSIAGSSADAAVDFTSNTERQNANIFCFVQGLADSKGKDFAFSASSTGEGTSSLLKRKQKKKFRRKMRGDSFVISPNVNGKVVSSVEFSPLTTANMSSHPDVMDRSQISEQFKEGDVTSSDPIQAACYKWRLRGNQAHKDGDLSKAEDFYTQGINSVPSSERSGCRVKPLLLCYSNRAATRMSLGRIREALEDCLSATALDPIFLKVQMRTANCHLLLGEVEKAQQCFNRCLESGNVVCLDRRIIVEAAEGSQKAQEVVKCTNTAAELLKERTSDAAGAALELLTKALSISSYSEKLLQLKAEALYLLQKYEAAVQLCEQSQYLAEKNLALGNDASISNSSMCDSYSSVKVWRWSVISKCYFYLGKLEASLNVLEKLQQVVSVNKKCVIDNLEDLLSLAATIRELLDLKTAGNDNFKLEKYTEAVESYTVALSHNIKSRPFAAVCYCNRAAAHQALGLIADAIADCSMAIALNVSYAKAISRRATLHEMVRDYEQAACDLRSLVSVLETQSNEKAKQADSPNGSNGAKELRQVHQRLLSVEDQGKKGTPLDFYLILGIKSDDTATDIKKAYHKAALRHHPDKAGQLLSRNEVGDEGQIWKEISQKVHKDADRLFKMIGEAYAVLSDPAKRSEYDLEEEIRKASRLNNRGGSCRKSYDAYGYGRPSDGYRSPSDRSSGRRYGRDHWKTYGYSYSRW